MSSGISPARSFLMLAVGRLFVTWTTCQATCCMTSMVRCICIQGVRTFEYIFLNIKAGYFDDFTISSAQDAEHYGQAKAFTSISTR